MNTAIFRDKLQLRPNLGMWLLIILVEICLAAIGTLFPIKPMVVVLIGIPLVFYLLSKSFHAFLLAILMLPFWEVTLSGVGDVQGQMDVRYSQIAVAIAVLSWFLNGLTTKNIYFETNPLNFPIVILVGWMLLSIVWAVNIYLGIREFSQVLYGVMVFFLTINSVKDEKTLNITLKMWIVAGLLCALSGMFELITITLPAVKKLSLGTITHWGDPVRVSGLKENPHRLGFLLNVCLMITVPQLIISKSKRYRTFLAFCVCGMLIVLVSTMSRSTWIGCFFGGACCSLYSKRLAKMFFISILIVLILFITITPSELNHAIIERVYGVFDPMETQSISGRSSVWDAGLKMFKERPLVGVGIGSFSALAKQYGSIYLDAPHDVYLFFLSEFGLIGLSIFLFLIFTIAVSIIKVYKRIQNDANKLVLVGLSIGIIIYFIQGIVVSYKFLEMEIWALLGLAMAAMKVFTSQEDKTKVGVAPANKPLQKNSVHSNIVGL